MKAASGLLRKTYFILFNDSVRLKRFSPFEGNLFFVCDSLDGVEGHGTWY